MCHLGFVPAPTAGPPLPAPRSLPPPPALPRRRRPPRAPPQPPPESGRVHRPPALSGDELGEVHRKPERVVELERLLAGDDRRAGGEQLLQALEAARDPLEEGKLLRLRPPANPAG